MKKIAYTGFAFMVPLLAFAQQRVTSIQEAGGFIIDIINNVLVPVVFALAFIVFIFGVFRYFISGGHDEEARDKGKQLMFFGIIGFFVMVSVWGLVNIIVGSVGLNNAPPNYLQAPPRN
jgi:hypothetical protein